MKKAFRLTFIFLFALFMLHLNAQAQHKNWKKALRQIPDQTGKLIWLTDAFKSGTYKDELPDMLDEAMKLAQEVPNDSLKGKVHYYTGNYYQRMGELQYAWEEYLQARIYYLRSRKFNLLNTLIYNQGIILVQQGFTDSLERFINQNQPLIRLGSDPTLKLYVHSLYSLAYFNGSDPQKALAGFYKLLPLAEQLNDTPLILSTCLNIGALQNTFDSTMMWYQKVLPVARKSLPDKYAEVLLKIGYLYNRRDDALKDSALHYFLEVDKNIDKLSSPVLKANAGNYTGDFFIYRGEYDLALPYLRKAYSYAKSINGNRTNMISHNLAICFLNLKQPDSCRYYLDIYKKQISGNGTDYEFMLYYHAEAKYLSAAADSCSVQVFRNYNLALEYAAKINETRIANTIIGNSAECMFKYKNRRHDIMPEAQKLLSWCAYFKPVIKTDDRVFMYTSFLDNYAQLEAMFGDQQKSLAHYEELTELLARIDTEKYNRGVNEAIIKYKSDLKDAEIAYGRKKNRYLTIGAILLFLIGVIIFIALWKTNKLNKQVLAQKTELQQLNQVKDRLFSVISHDMRTPLSSLIAFIQLLEKGISSEQLTAFTGELKTKMRHTAGLMDNLLNWAHTQMQGYNPRPVDTDLSALAGEVIGLLEPEAAGKKIRISNNIPAGTIIHADVNMLSLIIRNLLSNAIKYSHKEGAIRLDTNAPHSFTVTDEGVGMSEEMVRAFNDRTNHNTTNSTWGTSNEKGTGLGLMLCKNFASLMNGTIQVQSEPGKGTMFTVTLNQSRTLF